MARRTRNVAVAVAVGLAASLLGACGGTTHQAQQPAPTTPASGQSQIHWVKCGGAAGPKGYQCATVMVPRDPKNPALGEIPMAIDRRPASGKKIGSLLTNPGGPGVSGVDSLPTLVQQMPSSLLSRFDIVGFDPPGVARTAPIECLDDVQLAQYFDADPAPNTPAGFAHLVSEARTLAAGCESSSKAELPYVSTVDAAMDMDVLRQALGDSKLDYLGFSYGTLLGATYAGLYPARIRAMVLDGDLDPAIPAIAQADQQSASLQAQLEQMFTACTSSRSCPWTPGPDPEAAFEALVTRVRSDPVPVPGTSRTVGPAQLLYGAAWGLYFPQYWNFLEQGLQQLAGGNGSDILAAVRLLHPAQLRRHLQQSVRGERGGQLPGRPGPDHSRAAGRPARGRGGVSGVRRAQPLQRDRLLGLARSRHQQVSDRSGPRAPPRSSWSAAPGIPSLPTRGPRPWPNSSTTACS